MAQDNLNFAKITASPTPSGWSQVYSAGKLFAALSLQKETDEKDYLNILGKEILDILEQEFFTLETKDLDSIRNAVNATSQKIPQDVKLSFVIGAAVENILYLYILGNGKVDLKRTSSIGTLLIQEGGKNDSLKEASGFLENDDIIILQTENFANVISNSTLSEFLQNSNFSEAAENLAPLVLEKEDPAASCLLVEYKEPVKEEVVEPVLQETPKEEVEKQVSGQENQYFAPSSRGFKLNIPSFSRLNFIQLSGLSHSRRLVLTIAVVIVVVFVLSIIFALQKQKSDKLAADFNRIYPAAEKKYEEGQSLESLNQALARDSFTQAKNLLEQGKTEFVANANYENQITSLLDKVNEALSKTSPAKNVSATEVSSSESFYLSFELKQKALDYTKDTNNAYFVTQNGISQVANGTDSIKTLFVNKNDWKSVGGFATYNTNLYVLDKSQNQIFKFLNTGSDYEKNDYLPASASPDFSKAVSITIDNNIYVLYQDGTVSKYFKGQSQEFNFNGLDKNLSNPTKIYSSPTLSNIYVLDNGNSRIVTFDKSGNYKAQYSSSIINKAIDFEVLEADKKIYVLSGGKIYKINL